MGAGKTTAINELLARADRPIAVVVNDVGTVNVDAALIKRRTKDLIELTDGCVCCTMVNGFGAVFDQLRARPVPPDQVIVELSGIAEPDRVRPWGRSAGFSLDAVVVLVDADQFGSQPPMALSHIESQIQQADLLVLTKKDLCTPEGLATVSGRLGELAPDLPVVAFDQAVATGGLLSTGARLAERVVDLPASTLFDAHHVSSQPLSNISSESDITEVLDQLGPNVVRVKGIAELLDGTKLLVHQVGRRRSITVLPDSEHQDPTDLVVITVG